MSFDNNENLFSANNNQPRIKNTRGSEELREYFMTMSENISVKLGISLEDAKTMCRSIIRELKKNSGFVTLDPTKDPQSVIKDIVAHSDVVRKYVQIEVGSRQAISTPILEVIYKEELFPSSTMDYCKFLLNSNVEFVGVDIEGMALMNEEGADHTGKRLAGDNAIAKTLLYLDNSLNGEGACVVIGGDELGASMDKSKLTDVKQSLEDFNSKGYKVHGNNGKEFDLRITYDVSNLDSASHKLIGLAARVLEMPLTDSDVNEIFNNSIERNSIIERSKNWSKFRFLMKRSSKFRTLFLEKLKANSPVYYIIKEFPNADLETFFASEGVCSPLFFDVTNNPTDEELATAGSQSIVLKNLTLNDALLSSAIITKVVGAEVKMKTMNIEAYLKGDKSIEAAMQSLLDKALNIPSQDTNSFKNLRPFLERAFIKSLIAGPRPYLFLINKKLFLNMVTELYQGKLGLQADIETLSSYYDELVKYIDSNIESSDDRASRTAEKFIQMVGGDLNSIKDFKTEPEPNAVDLNVEYQGKDNSIQMAVTYVDTQTFRNSKTNRFPGKYTIIPNIGLALTEKADEQSFYNFLEFLFKQNRIGQLVPILDNYKELIKTDLIDKNKSVSSSNLKKLILKLQKNHDGVMSYENSYYYLFLLNRTPIYIRNLQSTILEIKKVLINKIETDYDEVFDNLGPRKTRYSIALNNLIEIEQTLTDYINFFLQHD